MQLEFFWRDESSLRHELESATGLPVQLKVTDNSTRMLTVKRASKGAKISVRVHRMFLTASPQVVKAIAAWVQKPRSRAGGALLNQFIRQNRHLIGPAERRNLPRRAVGACFNLRTIYDSLNAQYFGGTITAQITWGRMPPANHRRSIRFGSYTAEEDLIRIHPLLDQSFVPEYFVRYIVFHEMLHAHLGVDEAENGRRRVHTREFKEKERTYPDYDRAVAWQAAPANLRRLLKKMW